LVVLDTTSSVAARRGRRGGGKHVDQVLVPVPVPHVAVFLIEMSSAAALVGPRMKRRTRPDVENLEPQAVPAAGHQSARPAAAFLMGMTFGSGGSTMAIKAFAHNSNPRRFSS
jgi:hypothetical protein